MTRLLKPEEAAARLAVSPKAVRAWLREGRLPGIRLGRLWRISEEALERFMAGQGFDQDAAAARPPQAATEQKTPQSAPARPPQSAPEQRTPRDPTPSPKGRKKTREDILRWEEEHFRRMQRRRERKR